MRADIYPFQVLLVTLGGWINRHQERAIEYLLEICDACISFDRVFAPYATVIRMMRTVATTA